jgi:drug/metabolite transporter (DMT)-like permease
MMYWLASVMGFTLALVSMTIEGCGNVFSSPVSSTPERMVRTLGLIAARWEFGVCDGAE